MTRMSNSRSATVRAIVRIQTHMGTFIGHAFRSRCISKWPKVSPALMADQLPGNSQAEAADPC